MGKNVKYHKKMLMRITDDSHNALNSIYLRVTINRVQLRIATPIRIRQTEFNPETEEIRIPGDTKKSHDYTRVLASLMAKAENIFTKYMLMETPLTPDKFKTEWHIFGNRNSFLDFMEREIEHLKETTSRAGSTITVYNTILGKLRAFMPNLSFADMDGTWPENFDRYLNSKNLAANTRHKAHKTVKKFTNIALDKNLMFTDPYTKFKVKRIKGNRQHLHIDELKALIELEASGTLSASHQYTLRAFLFSCYTGVRLSDCRVLDQRSIINGVLTFKPVKTINDSIIVKSPLSEASMELVNKTGKLLTCISDSKINAALKVIANRASIQTPLTFHIARHTFGTHYILSGGNTVELMHLMGHSKIETTMIYVHMAEEQKAAKAGINQFDAYLKKSASPLRVVS
jgi:site-specific recombinase XerD